LKHYRNWDARISEGDYVGDAVEQVGFPAVAKVYQRRVFPEESFEDITGSFRNRF